MKNWREVPHLFANGKFEVESDYEVLDVIDWLYDRKYYDFSGQRFELKARPIKDLSDEELLEAFKDYNFDYELTSVKWNKEGYFIIKTGGGNPSFVQYLYPDKFRFQLVLNLLSIGVYPFNQDNPKDVIWRHENKKQETK